MPTLPLRETVNLADYPDLVVIDLGFQLMVRESSTPSAT